MKNNLFTFSPKMETYKCLALSTAHLTREEALRLDRLVLTTNRVCDRKTGYFVKLGANSSEAVDFIKSAFGEGGMLDIFLSAMNEGFELVEFDQDADVIEGLPIYLDAE